MRLIHLGDLHLGKSLGDYSLVEDQKYILDQILDIVKERSVDGVMVAGDVFDRSIPSEAAVNLLDDFLSSLAQLEVRTFVISGNHDSQDRLAYGGRLFTSRGIHIAAGFDGTLQKVTLEDDFGEVNIWMLPFVKASQVRHFYPDAPIESYEDAVRTIIEGARIDYDSRNVLMAHQFVSGDTNPKIAGSEGASVLNVGTVEVISSELFRDFDYVALGHIHSPQSVGSEQIRYSGSPLKYSLSEAGSDKSVPLIEIGEKGKAEIQLLPLKPRRDLRHIKGRLHQLLAKEAVMDTDDFMYVTLTDEDIISDAVGILRQYYPNVVKIDYQNSHTQQIEEFDLGEMEVQRPFRELISDFYLMMYGTEISDEEMSVMMEVAREEGVVHEAD